MNKFRISCLFAALLCVVPVAALVLPEPETVDLERRTIAAFPELPEKLRSRTVKRYFRGIDAFFADRFPLRGELLDMIRVAYEFSGDNMDMNRCYRGKDNWLFLGDGYGRSVEKLQGRAVLQGKSLREQAAAYEKRRDAAARRGAEFFIFIGPNKSSVYPEFLPPVIIPAPRRFITPLVEALRATSVNVYDPTERIKAAKSKGLLYYRTDTHWNVLGAYEAFEGFREYARLPELPFLSFADGPEFASDLIHIGGYKSFPLSLGDNFILNWRTPLEMKEENGLIINPRATSGKTVWVFGDSFRGALGPYFIATFTEIRFFHHNDFDSVMASELPKPDMIVWVMVERHFATAE